MSLQFNQVASPYRGLVQLYEREIGANLGDVSDNATKLAQFTSDCNQALDDFWAIALPASGTWQLDDSNQTDYPIIKTNLISGQRDYSFTTDGSGNLILDIYKVMILISATGTTYYEIFPIDQQGADQPIYSTIDTEITTTGTPYRYDKTANGIFLDPIPPYDATNGLKVYINREASYFSTTDTIKKAGVPGNLHKYFYLKPAYDYARRNNLANVNRLEAEVLKMEGAPGRTGMIEKQFGFRARDERHQLSMAGIQFR
jgi:hypothetical protein